MCRVDLRGGLMINMPSRFNLKLAFSVREYTTMYTNCLRWLGDHAGSVTRRWAGRSELGLDWPQRCPLRRCHQ